MRSLPPKTAALCQVLFLAILKGGQGEVENLPALSLALASGGELELDTIDTVDTVKKEDEDEDECDLHAILDFGDKRILRDKGEDFAFGSIRHGYDQSHEDNHLKDQQQKNLMLISNLSRPKGLEVRFHAHQESSQAVGYTKKALTRL